MSSVPAFDELIGRFAGVVGHVSPLEVHSGVGWRLAGADLGDMAALFPHVGQATGGRSTREQMSGAGGADDPTSARRLATIEAVERYASCVFAPDELTWATARELGETALDLEAIPRCSRAELADPACMLEPPRLDEPLRWVRGVDLHTLTLCWVPAIMSYLYITPMSRAERIWLPISTGCAAHTGLQEALVSALLEVVERDAIALTWLARLALPRLDERTLPTWAREHVVHNQADGIETLLYDATTDLGIPIVYVLELASHDPHASQLVACGSGLEAETALRAALRETVSVRTALAMAADHPDDVEAFGDAMHGASYMAHRDRREAFTFLLDQEPTAALPADLPEASAPPQEQLAAVLWRLRSIGASAAAVELTTDEALRAGLRVVRAIVPELQPLSFSPSTRFAGHPRLAEAPTRMGHPVIDEAALNPWPQPFA